MIEIRAGFFGVECPKSTGLQVDEGTCKTCAESKEIAELKRENGQFIIGDLEWDDTLAVLTGTMRRVRGNNLPAKYRDGKVSPVDASLAESTSFAYSPKRGQAIIQYNQHGPRHSLLGAFLEKIGIIAPVIVHPKLNTDALERLKHGDTVSRLEYSLGDITDETALRGAGVGGTLDQLNELHGLSIQVSVRLRRDKKNRQGSTEKAKAFVDKLITLTSVRSLKAGFKATDKHKMEMLNLLGGHRAVKLQVSEKGLELDHADCRNRLKLALTQQRGDGDGF